MEQLYVLTMDEETAVEDGLNDVRHGQTYSSADAEIRLKSWLGK
jgi:hypothetical protein